MLNLSHRHGRSAEQYAADYLAEQGLRIIARNVRKKVGELDIVCKDQGTWVCVEVKFRQASTHGRALEMVSPTKLRRMIAAFNAYLLDNGVNPAHAPMRFDIVAIDKDELIWLQNVTI